MQTSLLRIFIGVFMLGCLFFLPGHLLAWDPGEKVGLDMEWMPMSEKPEQRPEGPGPEPGTVWKEPVTGMEFLWIRGGCFKQGTPPTEVGRYDDEGPIHETCLDGFWMGKYEVTNAQYNLYDPEHESKKYEGHNLSGDKHPVVYVNWYEAMAYAKWLTERNKGKYAFWLPTEAEFEYACRGGTTTSRYWGDNPDDACKYANSADLTSKKVWKKWATHNCRDGNIITSEVGSFSPNPFGLHDILGNVWEWCQDWKGPYPSGDTKNPNGPPSSEEGRIVRGGSWDNLPSGVRCGNRSFGTPNFRRYNNGFRLVRTR